jgi:hypothetical protein
VKEVEEAHQGRIAVVDEPLARVLGDVERQRPVGAEESEESLLEPRRPAVARFARRQGRRREGHGRLLREAHRLVPGTQSPPELRLVGEQAFDAPERLKEIERPGRPRESGEQR